MSLPTSFTERAKAAGWAVMPLALMVLGVKIFWPDVTPGVMLGGTISGLLTALVALGIAIVYRANRIVNFSAADLGETPAILALLLYSSQGWNIYLATATGLVGAVVLGVLVEFLFLRRFFRAPRLILTVATIGVTQVVVALGLLLPQWLGERRHRRLPVVHQPELHRRERPLEHGVHRRRRAGAHHGAVDPARARRVLPLHVDRRRAAGHRRRTPTARRCSASRYAGCRASCGVSPALLAFVGDVHAHRRRRTDRSDRCSTPPCCSARWARR